MVENTSEFILVIQDGSIKFVNKKGLELSGYSPEEIIGKPGLQLIHPDDRKLVMERYQRPKVSDGRPSNKEIRVMPKDRSTRWAQMSAATIIWEERPAILMMCNDITERKKAEEALALANKQLKQYAHRITQVQEEERKRIAYELHDDTAQYLAHS